MLLILWSEDLTFFVERYRNYLLEIVLEVSTPKAERSE